MTFISTEEAVIFGPGSEWLWTMAQFLALAITGLAIVLQLRAQRASNRLNALASLVDAYGSERMQRHRLAVLMHQAAGSPGWPPALWDVGSFFDHMALLVQRGDIRLNDLWVNWRVTVQTAWLRSEACVREERTKMGPGLWERWEALAQTMADLDRRRGLPPVELDAARGYLLSAQISDIIVALRLEQEAKSGLVPTWPPAQTVEETNG